MSYTLAVDFDDTLYVNGAIDRTAAKVLAALKAQGNRLVLWLCRCNPIDQSPNELTEVAAFYEAGVVPARVYEQWERFDTMRAILKATGLWDLFDDVWQSPGKPMADIYIDDKAAEPQWAKLYAQLGGSP